jgi:hypothetical protein
VLTRFIYSFLIGISLLLIPQLAYADEILIELTPDIAYVDTVVDVTGPTPYVIETFTGPRFEQAPNGAMVERVAWVDSWLWLYPGVATPTSNNAIRADDDGNSSSNNYWASKITGTLDTGTYTIRATSYDYVVAGQKPIGTYTLSSNLIPPPKPIVPLAPVVVPPVVEPLPPEPISPPIIPFEPPLVIDIVAPEPPPIEVAEPPVAIEEPPAPAEEPPIEPEIAPVEEELPPTEVDTPPVVEEALPVEAEEPPAEVVQADEVDLETLAPETPVQLDNGVVLEAGTVVALQLLENPAELISAIFTNPAQALAAISNIGADMSDEERTTSQNTIIASVIAGQAAINAVGAATMARTPTSTPTGGGAPSANDNIKLYKRRKP